MKKEAELKFRVKNFGPIRRKLKVLGAKLIWKGREENWLFDTKDYRLQKKRAVLRVRKTDQGRLTWKEGQRVEHGAKVAQEYEVVVDKPHLMKSILRHMGFMVWIHYFKRREHWELKGAHIELDTLDSWWKFVEIEAPQQKIRALAKKLGLDFEKSTTKNYIQLLEEFRRKKYYVAGVAQW